MEDLRRLYHDQVRLIGASLSDIHERVYSIVFDAGATHGEPAAALASLQPWLLLAIPLALAWIVSTVESATLVVGTVAISLLSYISFNDFWPYAILRLSLLHYVAWTLPVLTCAGVAGAVDLIRLRRWKAFAAALASAALLASLRLTPVPVPIDHLIVKELANGHTRYELTFDRSHEVDAIDFAGAMAVDPRAVTMQSFAITADGHQLALYRGYRPIQLDGGFRIIFNRHVDAARVEVTLDRTVGNHPAKLPQVSAITFSLTAGAVCQQRTLAPAAAARLRVAPMSVRR